MPRILAIAHHALFALVPVVLFALLLTGAIAPTPGRLILAIASLAAGIIGSALVRSMAREYTQRTQRTYSRGSVPMPHVKAPGIDRRDYRTAYPFHGRR